MSQINSISFFVPGEPRGKGRPKAASRGKFVTVYTDKKTREYEQRIKHSYVARHGNFNHILDRAFTLDIIAYRLTPASLSKPKTEALLASPCKVKPDLDNIAKCIGDALNGLAFCDDSQMDVLICQKVYSKTREGVEVRLSWRTNEVLSH